MCPEPGRFKDSSSRRTVRGLVREWAPARPAGFQSWEKRLTSVGLRVSTCRVEWWEGPGGQSRYSAPTRTLSKVDGRDCEQGDSRHPRLPPHRVWHWASLDNAWPEDITPDRPSPAAASRHAEGQPQAPELSSPLPNFSDYTKTLLKNPDFKIRHWIDISSEKIQKWPVSIWKDAQHP